MIRMNRGSRGQLANQGLPGKWLLTQCVPYILAYKSKNFGQIFALKVGGSTYTRVIKFFFCRSDELRTPK